MIRPDSTVYRWLVTLPFYVPGSQQGFYIILELLSITKKTYYLWIITPGTRYITHFISFLDLKAKRYRILIHSRNVVPYCSTGSYGTSAPYIICSLLSGYVRWYLPELAKKNNIMEVRGSRIRNFSASRTRTIFIMFLKDPNLSFHLTKKGEIHVISKKITVCSSRVLRI